MTDVPHCQAAKDVLADAAAWPACQAPGLQAARERRDRAKEEGREEGKKEQKEQRYKEYAEESVCKERSGM